MKHHRQMNGCYFLNLVDKTRELDDTRLVTAALENHGKKGQNTMVVEDDLLVQSILLL